MENSTEEWRDIKGYKGRYQVSNIGRVRSLPRLIIRRNNVPKRAAGRVLKPGKNEHGYYVVSLSKNNKRKTFKVHRLVAIAFIPKIRGKTKVNHINFIVTDNKVENLEWCTQRENVKHTYANGRFNTAKGVLSGLSKLKDEDVLNIRKEYASGNITQKELGLKYSIDSSVICRIISRKAWRHI